MTTKRATVRVDADTRAAVSGMKRTGSAIDEVEARTERLSKSLGGLGDQTEAARGIQNGLARELAGLGPLAESAVGSLAKFGLVAGGIGLAASALGDLASKAVEIADESLRTQAVFNNLTYSIDGARTASRGLVDDMTLAESQVRALQLGAVDSLQGVEDLAFAGSTLGLVMSGDATKGIDDATTALARSSPLLLDNLGVTLTLSQAQEEYAGQLGKSVAELTAVEKAEAFRVVGLQKLVAAAKEQNIEESKALAVKRLAIIAENERLGLIGAEQAQRVRLKAAIDNLGDSVTHLNVQNRTHGADLKKVERSLAKYGLSIEDVGGKAKLQAEIQKAANDVIRRQALAAEEAAEAERKRAEAMQYAADMAEITQDVADIELDLRIRQAEGSATAEEAADIAISLANARLEQADRALEAARSEEELAKATENVAKAEEGVLLAEAKRRGLRNRRGRGGRRRDPLADLFKSRGDDGATDKLLAEWEAEDQARADRQLQLMEDVGALRMAQLEREQEREEQAFELRVARMEREIEARKAQGEETEFMERRLAELTEERYRQIGDVNAAEAAAHDERMRRLEEEMREREKLERVIEQGVRVSVQGLAESTEAAISAKDNKGAAFAAEVSEFAGSRAKILAIDAATHFALAAAYALALNPVKAAAELAAGAKSSAAAAAMGALAAATGAAAGVGGVDTGGQGGSVPRPQAPSRPDSAGTAPVSPLERAGQPASQAGSVGGGGGTVINFHAPFVDSGGQLQELINDASADGGRALRGGVG